MSNKLKSCPFCGGEKVRQSHERDASIVCEDCEIVFTLLVAPGGNRGWFQGTRDVWNSRAKPDAPSNVKPLKWETRDGKLVAETPFRAIWVDGGMGNPWCPWFCGCTGTYHKT